MRRGTQCYSVGNCGMIARIPNVLVTIFTSPHTATIIASANKLQIIYLCASSRFFSSALLPINCTM